MKRNEIKKCAKCNIYTIEDICNKCRAKTINTNPPKYSPEDKYGKYRRELKENSR